MSIEYKSTKDNIHLLYKDNFLDKEISNKIYNTFEKKLEYNSDEASMIKMAGKYVKVPRSQVAYGEPGTFYNFTGIKVNARSWNDDNIVCKIIKKIKEEVENFTGSTFNFVLINKYKDGEQYIGYHSDDERDLVANSDIVGVSFGAKRDLLLKAKGFIPTDYEEVITIPLDHNSIFVIKQPTNQHWMHSIPKRSSATTPRISLTFRHMVQ